MDCGLYKKGIIRRVILSLILFTFLNVASARNADGNLSDSISRLSRQIELYPDSIKLRIDKASLNIFLEQWRYARNECNEILKRDGNNPVALFYRAYAHDKLGMLKFARKDYEALLTIVPGHFEAQLALAIVNQKDRHYTAAFDILNRLVGQYPTNHIIYSARASLARERGMYDFALLDITDAIKLYPKEGSYYIERAELYLLCGNKAAARNDLDKAVSLGISRGTLKSLYRKCR